jgi:AraC family transcriptional regulator
VSRTTKPLTDYHARFQRVSDYIHDHLDQSLNMLQLAELAHLSAEHWHRIYAAFFGETMAATVKRLRLQRAAAELAQTGAAVSAIAKKWGYPNVQSFTRTFTAVYGQAPATFRETGQHIAFHYTRPDYQADAFAVKLVEVSALNLVGVPHQGSFMEIGKAFGTLYGWLGAQRLEVRALRSIGVYWDDPFAVQEKDLRSQACVEWNPAQIPEALITAPLEHRQLVGGTYAVLQYQGPYASMHAAYRWLFGYWLPQSGREVADAPVFEEYLNSPLDTAPTALRTDIYMPLRALH